MIQSYKSIVIIGAPRSGTNMLRNILCSFDGVGTWPCDEINYIWRHGNIGVKSDEFTPSMATVRITKYIRNQVNKLAKRENLDIIVEKTCANSLRVGFVNKVLPDAHYIFIVRNGLDVVASSNLRWSAKLDIPYLLKKVKYVPAFDLPYYATRYLWSHIYRKFSGEKRLAFWGPQLNKMKELFKNKTLDEISALQWKSCIAASERDFFKLPNERITRVKYEEFVNSPEAELARICKEVNISVNDEEIKNAVSYVSNKSVGKWKIQLDEATKTKLNPVLKETMKRYGYIN